jgi:hypothetical protein
MTPGLYLLGFTKMERFKPEHQIKHAYFVYPYEEAVRMASKSYVGSKRLFTSLLATLIAKEKVGLGVLVPRISSTPTLVLIVPQQERTENDDPEGKQLEPPGFHLIQLAYADDMRGINVASSIPCATEADDGTLFRSAWEVVLTCFDNRGKHRHESDRSDEEDLAEAQAAFQPRHLPESSAQLSLRLSGSHCSERRLARARRQDGRSLS